MVPGGRKHSGKSGKPPLIDQPKKAFDFEKEDKDLSGSEEDAVDGKYLMLSINNILESIYFELATLKTELRKAFSHNFVGFLIIYEYSICIYTCRSEEDIRFHYRCF